jgi:hypothetical protein
MEGVQSVPRYGTREYANWEQRLRRRAARRGFRLCKSRKKDVLEYRINWLRGDGGQDFETLSDVEQFLSEHDRLTSTGF